MLSCSPAPLLRSNTFCAFAVICSMASNMSYSECLTSNASPVGELRLKTKDITEDYEILKGANLGTGA